MNKIIAIAGPTAVGKTKFAIEVAKAFNGEVVSCDSMQLYKYMDIGSAKPTPEEMAQAKHHLVDFLDPRDEFSVSRYQEIAKEAINDILNRGKIPVISGGTGLYLNSLLYNMDFSSVPGDYSYRNELTELAEKEGNEYIHNMLVQQDPEAASKIHPNNVKKVVRALERLKEGEGKIKQFSDIKEETTDYEAILIGLTRDREELYNRINLRVDLLMEAGLLEEVQQLMNMGLTPDNISMKGIGYKEIMDYLDGKYSLEEAVETVKKNTRHYAKKQLTWFRRYDKMNWLDISKFTSDDEAIEDMKKWIRTKL